MLETLCSMFPKVERDVLSSYLVVEGDFDRVVDIVQTLLKTGKGLKKKGTQKYTPLPHQPANVWATSSSASAAGGGGDDLGQCLSTKIKREELARLFPMLPEDLRESIFKNHK